MIWNWFKTFPDFPFWLQLSWVAWASAGIILFAVSANVAAQKPPVGKIEMPPQGQAVPRTFQASGSISNLPKGHSLWLAVLVGDLLWPREPKITPTAGKWFSTVSEGGNPPGGRFSVVLLATTPSATADLEKWFKRGDFSGIPRHKIRGMLVLDEVPLALQQDQL